MFSGCLSFCVCVRAACISQQYQSTGLVFSNLSYKQLLLELVPCLFFRTCRVDVWKSSLLISFLLHILYIFLWSSLTELFCCWQQLKPRTDIKTATET